MLRFGRRLQPPSFTPRSPPHRRNPTSPLVNCRHKLVRDRPLDRAVARERLLRPVLHLLHLLSSSPCLPLRSSSPLLRTAALFPSLFHLRDVPPPNSKSIVVDTPPLSRQSRNSHHPILFVHPTSLSSPLILLLRTTTVFSLSDFLHRLKLLVSLSPSLSFPVHSLQLLSFDLGLPSPILPQIPPDQFHLDETSIGLVSPIVPTPTPRLLLDNPHKPNAFPVHFPRGYGMSQRWMRWLEEFQQLPYTSPYSDASQLDPRTDESEKRIVGVFHELLHLMIAKRTERANVSNLRRVFGLPFKFTKVFERHPGIFYISKKLGRDTVVLREAYGEDGLLQERWRGHPMLEFRERVMEVMREGGLREVEGSGSEREDDSI